ncbi:MAG: hypothetical protein MUF54_02335 [Polyangiaceae bacterium]|jgi:hypothetical protein|nr:hypothetical protein [Polyangiaceae bacterium]
MTPPPDAKTCRDHNAAALFERAFRPLYPPALQPQLDKLRTSPGAPCDDPAVLGRIDQIADAFREIAPDVLGLPADALDDTDASIHCLGAVLTKERRDELLARTSDDEPVPMLATVVIHGTLYVARCIVRNHRGRWRIRTPLWESTIALSSAMGDAELAIFQWWLKSLSDPEVERLPLGARYRQYVEIPCFDAQSLPVVAPADRTIPRIACPTFAQLFRHLKAHVPEIREPGPHFPSADRFAQLKLEWVDFLWLGDGRMLLMHGPGRLGGAHLFWMDRQGFVKAAYYPADAAPTHLIRLENGRLRVIVSVERSTRVHEMPWWGL